MDIFNTFATDPKRELTGAWVDLVWTPVEGKKAPRLLVARLGNRINAKLMTRLYKENRVALAGPDEDITSALDEKLNIEASAKTILLGWEGLEYKGEPIEYSYANAVMLLEHSDFRNLVLAHARQFDHYRADKEDAAKKD